MTMYTFQLVLGLVGIVLWGGVAFRWLISADKGLPPAAQVAFVVSFASTLVICVFGSLRLLQVLTDDMWALTGTLLRGVVVAGGAVALLSMERE